MGKSKLKVICIFILGLLSLSVFAQNEIDKLCSKTGVPVLKLKYRDRNSNINKVRKFKFADGKVNAFLKKYYSQKEISINEPAQVALSNKMNKMFQKKSEAVQIALKWASRDARIKEPQKYISNLIKFIKLTIPSLGKEVDSYLDYKNKDLLRSEIIPAPKDSNDFYGARGGSFTEGGAKYVRMVKVSNNPSESFTYLAPLVGHETIHAVDSFQDRRKLDRYNNFQWAEWSLLNETKAYDYQYRYYIEAVKKNPNLFCNWLYPTWSYGELIVPLSWTMSAMLDEALKGKLIYKQLKLPLYSPYSSFFLKGKGKSRFKQMLKQVKDSNYQYVK